MIFEKKYRMRGKALIFALSLLAFSAALSKSYAATDRAEPFETRSMQIWGKSVGYQFVLKNDATVKFDGEAFTKELNGQKTPYIVLNKAFFKKEAQEIFHKFEKSDFKSAAPTDSNLVELENNLLILKVSQNEIPKIDATIKASLMDLKNALQQLAWSELYHNSVEKTSDHKAAEAMFVEEFAKVRMNTIEYHEVAHLLDLQSGAYAQDSGFEKFSELNAFYSELTYGSNPRDVVEQAIAGLIDEMNRGKMIDYSVIKVATVLKYLKNSSKVASANGGLGTLAKVEKSDFILAGQNLYQKNSEPSKLALANLR